MTRRITRDAYIERVRAAMELDPEEMSYVDYIHALEEIAVEVASMLEAAREEQAEEDDL